VIRLFVAIPFPPALRQRLATISGGIPNARWTDEENFHLTLRFIGEVDEGTGHDVAEALASVRGERFALTLHGIDQFGKGEKARVLWMGVDKNPALLRLHDRIESTLVRAGLEPEGRKFTPHVTLARLYGASPDSLGAFVQSHQLVRLGPIAVESFALFSSWQHGEGPVYEIEAEYLLTPPVTSPPG
jgi:2'-5' RNA ligase